MNDDKIDLGTIKFKTGKGTIGELLLLTEFARSFDYKYAINLYLHRAILGSDERVRADLKRRIVNTMLDLDDDEFEVVITNCVANIQQPDGKYLWPDSKHYPVAYQDRVAVQTKDKAPAAPAPEVDTKLSMMWGQEE